MGGEELKVKWTGSGLADDISAEQNARRYFPFYLHLFIYILVISLLFTINMLSGAQRLWFLYPAGGWLVGILIHGTVTFKGSHTLAVVMRFSVLAEKLRLRVVSWLSSGK